MSQKLQSVPNLSLMILMILMILSGSKWSQMISNNLNWSQIDSNGLTWFQNIPNCPKLFQIVPETLPGSKIPKWSQMFQIARMIEGIVLLSQSPSFKHI